MADAAARPYADALYDAAHDAGRLADCNRDLERFAAALAGSRDLTRALANPAFPAEAKRRVLTALAGGGDSLVASFLQVLVDHGRIDLVVDAQAAFATRYGREQNELAVEVTTAVPIDDAQADGLKARLEAATGQSVTIRRAVDPSIIGGVVLRIRDLLVDASVRRRLDGLRLSLTNVKLPHSIRDGGEA